MSIVSLFICMPMCVMLVNWVKFSY